MLEWHISAKLLVSGLYLHLEYFLYVTISVSLTHGNLEAVFLVLICKVFQIAFALFDIR